MQDKKQKRTVNEGQFFVATNFVSNQHLLERFDLIPSPLMCTDSETGTSNDPRSIVSGNHDDLSRVDEIAILYRDRRVL
jgi:hypothetical protein